MRTSIYVGNLSVETTPKDLAAAFRRFGRLVCIRVVSDSRTGLSAGFGLVEMQTGGPEAIVALDGSSLQGKTLLVKEVPVREPLVAATARAPSPGKKGRRCY